MANGKNTSFETVKIIVSLIIIITAVAGVILWAVNSHSEIREWTADQDYVTKMECKELMKDNYVRRYEFATIMQQIKTLELQLEELKGRSSYLKDNRNIRALVPNKAGDDER